MTRSRSGPSGERGNEGFILIAVLWLLAALAELASIGAVYGIESAVAARVPDDRLQAEAAIRAGVELSAYRSLVAPKPKRPSHGQFEAKIGDTKISVQFRTEAARIDLNAAPKEMLTGLFLALGVRKPLAEGYADRVIGWRQKASDADGSEASAYREAGLTYPPREAPFNDALELGLVMGLPPTIVERMLPLVTVYSGKAQVNVDEAEPQTLAALPGLTPDLLQEVLQARANGADGQALLQRLGPAAQAAATDPSDAIRASIVAELRNGRRVQAEIVFRLTDGKPSPFDILYWRDDLDGPMRQG